MSKSIPKTRSYRGKFTRLAFLVFSGILLLAALQGCKPKAEVINPRVAPPKPQTFVSLSPDAAELTNYLMMQLVGRTAMDDYPPNVLKAPIVAEVKPNYEEIEKIHPDLIIYDPILFNANDIEKINQMNIKTFPLDGDTVSDFITTLFTLGSIAQSETEMNTVVQNIHAEIIAAEADPITQPHHVALVMPIPNSNPMIAGTGSFSADIVRQGGGIPVGPSGNKFVTIDAESLLKLNPDVILVSGSLADGTAFAKDPRFSQMAALKSGHIFAIPQDIILRKGSRINEAIKSVHSGLTNVLRSSH